VFGLTPGALLEAKSLRVKLVRALEKPLTGLFLTAGLVVTAHPQVLANRETVSVIPDIQTNAQTIGALQTEASDSQSLADGIYLYGQSPEREQIGAAYMVFQVEQGQVEGAFYMPRSSFDCFYGSFQGDRLALTVINSYEQAQYPYAIALEPQDSVAAIGNETATPIGLQGYHQLESPTENDLRILSTCQTNQ